MYTATAFPARIRHTAEAPAPPPPLNTTVGADVYPSPGFDSSAHATPDPTRRWLYVRTPVIVGLPDGTTAAECAMSGTLSTVPSRGVVPCETPRVSFPLMMELFA